MPNGQPTRLKVVAGGNCSSGPIGLPCKRPTCPNHVRRGSRGRPADFCSKQCQQVYRRERDRVVTQLRETLAIAAAYEIEADASDLMNQRSPSRDGSQPAPSSTTRAKESDPVSMQPDRELAAVAGQLALAVAAVESAQTPQEGLAALDQLKASRDSMFRVLATLVRP